MNRLLIISVIIFPAALQQGCSTVPHNNSFTSCKIIRDPYEQADCMDKEMFGDVLAGAALGAVLGGVVAFAVTRDKNNLIIGAMVGGIAGGLAVYLDRLHTREAGNPNRMTGESVADLQADSRHIESRFAVEWQIYDNDKQKNIEVSSYIDHLKSESTRSKTEQMELLNKVMITLNTMADQNKKSLQMLSNVEQTLSVYKSTFKRLESSRIDKKLVRKIDGMKQKISQLEVEKDKLKEACNQKEAELRSRQAQIEDFQKKYRT